MLLWSVHWPEKRTVKDYVDNFCVYVMGKALHSDVYLGNVHLIHHCDISFLMCCSKVRVMKLIHTEQFKGIGSWPDTTLCVGEVLHWLNNSPDNVNQLYLVLIDCQHNILRGQGPRFIKMMPVRCMPASSCSTCHTLD